MSGTGSNSKPWTEAIDQLLSDGQWHLEEEVLAAGAALVPDDRAEREMRNRSGKHDRSRMLEIGRKNVAKQSVSGMVRFYNAEEGQLDGKRAYRKLDTLTKSPGKLAARVDELERKLEQALLDIDALLAFREFVESQQAESPAVALFEAASTSAVSSQ